MIINLLPLSLAPPVSLKKCLRDFVLPPAKSVFLSPEMKINASPYYFHTLEEVEYSWKE